MSRLTETVIKGKTVWVEADRPDDCPDRHGRIGATWAQCPEPTCRAMCRQWPCRADGCTWRLVDPEHRHVDAAPGAHRGG